MKEYIPTATNFYSKLSDKKLREIKDKIKSKKEVGEILNKMKVCISSKKHNYIRHLKKLKQRIYKLNNGMSRSDYVVSIVDVSVMVNVVDKLNKLDLNLVGEVDKEVKEGVNDVVDKEVKVVDQVEKVVDKGEKEEKVVDVDSKSDIVDKI